MAIFGAPDHQADHAERAARAAASMAARAAERAGAWEALQFAGMKIGVGVQTGLAVVGTVGCPGRLDYTAIGATVNAAARIESATKDLRVSVLIGSPTRDALSLGVRARLSVAEAPDLVRLKGMTGLVEVYRLGVGAGLVAAEVGSKIGVHHDRSPPRFGDSRPPGRHRPTGPGGPKGGG
jgi:adenylate cyclase